MSTSSRLRRAPSSASPAAAPSSPSSWTSASWHSSTTPLACLPTARRSVTSRTISAWSSPRRSRKKTSGPRPRRALSARRLGGVAVKLSGPLLWWNWRSPACCRLAPSAIVSCGAWRRSWRRAALSSTPGPLPIPVMGAVNRAQRPGRWLPAAPAGRYRRGPNRRVSGGAAPSNRRPAHSAINSRRGSR